MTTLIIKITSYLVVILSLDSLLVYSQNQTNLNLNNPTFLTCWKGTEKKLINCTDVGSPAITLIPEQEPKNEIFSDNTFKFKYRINLPFDSIIPHTSLHACNLHFFTPNTCTPFIQQIESSTEIVVKFSEKTKVLTPINNYEFLDFFLNLDIGVWEVLAHVVFKDVNNTSIHVALNVFVQVSQKIEYKQLSKIIRIFAVLVGVVIMLLSITFSVFCFMNRHKKAIKAGSTLFLLCFCFGCFLLAASLLPIYFSPLKNDSCVGVVWIFNLGFAIAFSSLIIKNYRLLLIFKKKEKIIKADSLNDQKMFLVLLSCVFVFVAFLIIWTIVDPPGKVYEDYLDLNTKTLYKTPYCNFNHWNYIDITMQILLMITGMVIVFLTRSLPKQYNESFYIGLAIYNWTIFRILVIGLNLMTNLSKPALFVLNIVFIILTIPAMLFLIFIPKFLKSDVGVGFTSFKSQTTKRTKNGQVDPAVPQSNANNRLSTVRSSRFLGVERETTSTNKLNIQSNTINNTDLEVMKKENEQLKFEVGNLNQEIRELKMKYKNKNRRETINNRKKQKNDHDNEHDLSTFNMISNVEICSRVEIDNEIYTELE